MFVDFLQLDVRTLARMITCLDEAYSMAIYLVAIVFLSMTACTTYTTGIYSMVAWIRQRFGVTPKIEENAVRPLTERLERC